MELILAFGKNQTSFTDQITLVDKTEVNSAIAVNVKNLDVQNKTVVTIPISADNQTIVIIPIESVTNSTISNTTLNDETQFDKTAISN